MGITEAEKWCGEGGDGSGGWDQVGGGRTRWRIKKIKTRWGHGEAGHRFLWRKIAANSLQRLNHHTTPQTPPPLYPTPHTPPVSTWIQALGEFPYFFARQEKKTHTTTTSCLSLISSRRLLCSLLIPTAAFPHIWLFTPFQGFISAEDKCSVT